jgi:hypothetical protein
LNNIPCFLGLVNPEKGLVIPAEDDDVARERELIQSKPVTVLQKDNNLVIKYWQHATI